MYDDSVCRGNGGGGDWVALVVLSVGNHDHGLLTGTLVVEAAQRDSDRVGDRCALARNHARFGILEKRPCRSVVEGQRELDERGAGKQN